MNGGGGLYAGEIDCVVSRLLIGVRWLGVFARDEMLDLTREIRPWCLNINIDSKDQSGTHWLILYAPIAGGIKLLDSFGLFPIIYSLDFLEFVYYSFLLQSLSSTVCGHYCIVYIYFRCCNNSLSEPLYLLTKISGRDL